MNKKVICICVPCYNEEKNIVPLVKAIEDIFKTKLNNYEYVIQFIDNCSTDSTQEIIKQLCQGDKHIRAIFNLKNFKSTSALHGMLQVKEDCAIYLSADFQDPIDKIPEMIEKWENGAAIVAGIKQSTKDRMLKKICRNIYYDLMNKYSKFGFIKQFCNFGVYDKRFLDILRNIKNPYYSIRGNVVQYGFDIDYIEYEQPKRKTGKSNFNLGSLIDLAINNFINYTDVIIRRSTLIGGIFSILFFICLVVFAIIELVKPENSDNIAIFIFIIGMLGISINAFLIGIIGEYILNIKSKVSEDPLVIEKERINFNANINK